MRENTLLLYSIAWSVIGLLILLLLAFAAEPKFVQISDLETKVGKIVAVQAYVDSVDYAKEVVFITLDDNTGEILAVLFGRLDQEILVDDIVAVKGKVQIYRGQLEIVVEELQCLSC